MNIQKEMNFKFQTKKITNKENNVKIIVFFVEM